MKYIFDNPHYHGGINLDQTDGFRTTKVFKKWLNNTSIYLFLDSSETKNNKYFKLIEERKSGSDIISKYASETTFIVIQNKVTKEFWGCTVTEHQYRDAEHTPWEKFDRIKTRPVVYKYVKKT